LVLQVKDDGTVAMDTQYPSEISDRQWGGFEEVVAEAAADRAATLEPAVVLNAILYVVRTGCQWRQLPTDFPKWKSVYSVFWRWRKAGLWQQIHDALREQVRRRAGKRRLPSAAIVDSQSVRTAEGGWERGFDAGTKVTGRKRHLAVDTLGMILMVVVHRAEWQNHDGAAFVLTRLKRLMGRLKVVFADSAYGRNGLPEWVSFTFGWVLQTVLRPVNVKGFVVLPKRWIVERTFSWIGRYRRHSKDYERNPETSEAMIHVAMINLMSRRLTANGSLKTRSQLSRSVSKRPQPLNSLLSRTPRLTSSAIHVTSCWRRQPHSRSQSTTCAGVISEPAFAKCCCSFTRSTSTTNASAIGPALHALHRPVVQERFPQPIDRSPWTVAASGILRSAVDPGEPVTVWTAFEDDSEVVHVAALVPRL
jgi:putative transposase